MEVDRGEEEREREGEEEENGKLDRLHPSLKLLCTPYSHMTITKQARNRMDAERRCAKRRKVRAHTELPLVGKRRLKRAGEQP